MDFIRSKPYGIVHKRDLVEINGKRGWLVWDYILYNELTFEEADTGKKISLMTGFSDDRIEKEYNRWLSQYGVK